MIGWILQTAMVFAILYYIPWFGDFIGQAKEVVPSVLSAILVSTILTLGWELIKAPAVIYQRQKNWLQMQAEAINLHRSEESITSEGYAIRDRWCQTYEAAHGETRLSELCAHEAEASAFLMQNYSVSDFQNFKSGVGFVGSNSSTTLDGRFEVLIDRLGSVIYTSRPSSAAIRDRIKFQLRQNGNQ